HYSPTPSQSTGDNTALSSFTTRRSSDLIVIWNINNYFDNMENMMQVSVDKHFITDDCRSLYYVCNTIDEILDYIENYDETDIDRSEEHTSELQSRFDLVCRLLLEKKKD